MDFTIDGSILHAIRNVLLVFITIILLLQVSWYMFLYSFRLVDNYMQERYWRFLHNQLQESNKNIVPYTAVSTECSHETSERP